MNTSQEHSKSLRDFEISCDGPKIAVSTAETTNRSTRKQFTVRRKLQPSEVKSLSKEPVKIRIHSIRSHSNLKELNESALKSFDIYEKASYPNQTA